MKMEQQEISMDKKYRYRRGGPARILCIDRPKEQCPVLSMDEFGTLHCHYYNGKIYNDQLCEFDLIAEKDVLWVNVYGNGSTWTNRSKIEDGDPSSKGRIARIKVEYVEGQFDE